VLLLLLALLAPLLLLLALPLSMGLLVLLEAAPGRYGLCQ
jgi:hypothetical protein